MDVLQARNVTIEVNQRYGWVQDINFRGTFSILLSCVSTFFLCTWSVMHLNIPNRSKNRKSYVKAQILWCLIGIFGPELAIWSAWRQYMSAKALRDLVRKELEKKDHTREQSHAAWTITHGFYAVMGGFVLDLDGSWSTHQPRIMQNITRLTLTPKGVLLLARCGYTPMLSKREILDKSKTDELGKLLACVQAAWMIIQVCSRLGSQMPVTLLEVSAIGHVLCALVLYTLWWNKPRWVMEPTSLQSNWPLDLCAFMCMASQINDDNLEDGKFQERFVTDDSEISRWRFRNFELQHPSRASTSMFLHETMSQETIHETMEMLEPSEMKMVCRPRTRSINEKGSRMIQLQDVEAAFHGDEVATARYSLASQAISRYVAVRELMHFPYPEVAKEYMTALHLYPEMPDRVRAGIPSYDPVCKTWLECETEHLVCLAASNWPTEGLLRPTGGLAMGMVLWFSSVAFSVVHVAAWNGVFATPIEGTLWRIAALYLGASGCLWSAIHALAHFSVRFWWIWYHVLVGETSRVFKYPLMTICSLCGAFYVASRLFLIVDSFAGFRSLPGESFLIPQWTLNVPHL